MEDKPNNDASDATKYLYPFISPVRKRWCPHAAKPHQLCFRLNCGRQECRLAARLEIEAITKKGISTFEADPIWFVSINLSNDAYTIFERYEYFKVKFKSLINRWRIWAIANEKELKYAKFYGIKSPLARFQEDLHAHILVNWLPNPLAQPTPRYPSHFVSPQLDAYANSHGLTTWTSQVDDVHKVVEYCVENSEDVLRKGNLGVKSKIFSRNWYPMTPYQKQRLRNSVAADVRSILSLEEWDVFSAHTHLS